MATNEASHLTVRTVTVFLPTAAIKAARASNDLASLITRASRQTNKVATSLRGAGIEVQTTRIAAPSPAAFGTPTEALNAARLLGDSSVDHASVGAVQLSESSFQTTSFFTSVLLSSSVFISLMIATPGVTHPRLARLAADVVHAVAPHEGGLCAFRFAALANVAPGAPFFPAAYAPDEADGLPVAIGVQAAPLVHSSQLTAAIEAAAERILAASPIPVALDFSLAPFPTSSASTASALAAVASVPAFPMPGCLHAAARVAAAVQAARFPKAGLNGIMLPVLEDLGIRAATVPDLLLCAAVCGTGLDAIPLAGDTSVETLYGIYLDVAALSCRLGAKQLTARLIPIPGKRAGELTQFDHGFLCNNAVLSVAQVPHGRGIHDDVVSIEPIPTRSESSLRDLQGHQL